MIGCYNGFFTFSGVTLSDCKSLQFYYALNTELVELSCDLPIIIEIVDTEEYIENFLPYLDDLINKGMVTIENIEVKKYGKNLPNHE